MLDVNQLIGTHDILLLTLDTLRFDVASVTRTSDGELVVEVLQGAF